MAMEQSRIRMADITRPDYELCSAMQLTLPEAAAESGHGNSPCNSVTQEFEPHVALTDYDFFKIAVVLLLQ